MVSTWVGASRATRSLNFDRFIIQGLHHEFGQHAHIRDADGIPARAFNMGRAEAQRAIVFQNLGD